MINRDSGEAREFEITYVPSDTVCSDEMIWDGETRPIPISPQDVALFAVQRLLDGAGPEIISVDVKDERGVTHRFEAYRWENGSVRTGRLTFGRTTRRLATRTETATDGLG